MRFYEYESKVLFRKRGMPLGKGRVVNSAAEAQKAAAEIAAPVVVKGEKARCVLIEEKSPIAKEYFASVTWDGRRQLPVLLFSDMGGIDIEEVAERIEEIPGLIKKRLAAVGVEV